MEKLEIGVVQGAENLLIIPRKLLVDCLTQPNLLFHVVDRILILSFRDSLGSKLRFRFCFLSKKTHHKINLLYTYKWYDFWTVCFLAIWYRKPDQRAEVFWNHVSKGAKIRNRYNQVPHLTQNTKKKVTNSQLNTTGESQEVSPFPAGDHYPLKRG